jgi:hypothetical protein
VEHEFGSCLRGIVELVTLHHIQAELGLRLPLPTFFDLIASTSNGEEVVISPFITLLIILGAVS